MMEAASASSRVLESPRPNVWLTAFGERSVEHEIRIWIKDPEAGVGSVRSEIHNRLWLLFKENGIELPFPQRDIRVKDWPASAVHPKLAAEQAGKTVKRQARSEESRCGEEGGNT